MFKRFLGCAVVILIAAGLCLAAEGSWTGWVTDLHCAAKGASAKHADCAKKCVEGQGSKYALFVPADKKVYTLDPQDQAAAHAGHYVIVKGSADGSTIKATSIEMTPEPKS